jgi:hypothetical protein
LQRHNILLTATTYVFRCHLQRAKFSWHLPWDIQVTNHQENNSVFDIVDE